MVGYAFGLQTNLETTQGQNSTYQAQNPRNQIVIIYDSLLYILYINFTASSEFLASRYKRVDYI